MPLATLPGGGPITMNNVQSKLTMFKPIPHHTPMRPKRCHNCANQQHPDTMHNITPPHKGAVVFRRTKNGKRIPQNESPKPSKGWPRTNQGIYCHSGCGPSAQPIGPSTQVRCTERNFFPHVGPQQALVLYLQMVLWPHTPQSLHQLFFRFPLFQCWR